MAVIVGDRWRSLGVWTRFRHCARSFTLQRLPLIWLAFALSFSASTLAAQTFEPTVSVGGGIQTSYEHVEANASPVDQFALNHARIYLGGAVTKNISLMFNTDYNTTTNAMGILDAVAQIDIVPQAHIWFGRFLPPSDRANLYGPFYSNNFFVFQDGIQDGYPFVFQGRDNGIAYWGDFKTGPAKWKLSAGAFDGASSDGNKSVIWGGRLQLDLWDPENGYYQNGTYYGDKNLLALGGATQVQGNRTATTFDFLFEKKVLNGGAVTVESEFSDYNGLGGYDPRYGNSSGAYGLVSFLTPKKVGIGKFELLGKYGIAEFTQGNFRVGSSGPRFQSYRQNTTEVDIGYVIKEFDARFWGFYADERFNQVKLDSWVAGLGLQIQISKTIPIK
jgi:hypothetical protein